MNILFARHFTASVSGEVFYLFAVFTFVVQAVGFSLESGIGFFSARSQITDARLVSIMISWAVAAAALVFLVFVVFNNTANGLGYPLFYPVCFVFGNVLINFGNAFCFSKYQYVLPNLVGISVALLLSAVLLAAESGFRLPFSFIPLYFYSPVLQGVILFAVIILKYKFEFSFSAADLRPLIRFSYIAFITNLLTLALNRSDYFFVNAFTTTADMGNYIQVAKIAQVFFLLPSMISSVLFPVIASGKKLGMYPKIAKLSRNLFFGYAALCIIPVVFGGWLFPWLYGGTFDKMYITFLLYVPGILAMSSLYPLAVYFAGTNRVRINLAATSVALLINVAGNILFVPRYGIYAAAVSSSVSYIVYWLYLFLVFRKEKEV